MTPDNKLLTYIAIIKPVYTYGIQLCGTAPTTVPNTNRRSSESPRSMCQIGQSPG